MKPEGSADWNPREGSASEAYRQSLLTCFFPKDV